MNVTSVSSTTLKEVRARFRSKFGIFYTLVVLLHLKKASWSGLQAWASYSGLAEERQLMMFEESQPLTDGLEE